MTEMYNVSHIKDGKNESEKDNTNENSENGNTKLITIGDSNELDIGAGKDNKENSQTINGRISNRDSKNAVKDEGLVAKNTIEPSETRNTEVKGTSSANVSITMIESGQCSQGATVITTAPVATGPPKPKPKLVRRKSLNPRVMTPPGLEVLDNIQLLAIRQQMEMDIHSM